jgi:nucleoid-associated protein YgaU
MQDLERYGLITVLFLLVSVGAIWLWSGDPQSADPVAAPAGAGMASGSGMSSGGATKPPAGESAPGPRGRPQPAGESERLASAAPVGGDAQQGGALQPARRESFLAQGDGELERARAAEAERRAEATREEQRRAAELLDQQRRAAARPEGGPSAPAGDGASRGERSPGALPAGGAPAFGGANVLPETPPVPALTRPVVVAEGDSLWKIAERELGQGHRMSLIVALNPTVNADRIRPGMTLQVPTAAGLAAQAAGRTAGERAAGERAAGEPAAGATASETGERGATAGETRTAAAATPPSRGAPAAGRPYQVARGDSAWRIAERFSGQGERWRELRALNPGVNLDAVPAGVTLQLPADWNGGGAVASATGSAGRSKVR